MQHANMWLPNSYLYREANDVNKAVREYDERLGFGRNEETGQWCIFMRHENGQIIPILGFNNIPHPDDALRRLYKSDSRRRGAEILDEINKNNAKIEKDLETKAQEATEETAEAFEWAYRKEGLAPTSRIFIRRRD